MSQIYFIGVTLYVFRMVFPSADTADCLLACNQQYLFDICLLQYLHSLTPDNGWKDSLKHVKCYSNKINLSH